MFWYGGFFLLCVEYVYGWLVIDGGLAVLCLAGLRAYLDRIKTSRPILDRRMKIIEMKCLFLRLLGSNIYCSVMPILHVFRALSQPIHFLPDIPCLVLEMTMAYSKRGQRQETRANYGTQICHTYSWR